MYLAMLVHVAPFSKEISFVNNLLVQMGFTGKKSVSYYPLKAEQSLSYNI